MAELNIKVLFKFGSRAEYESLSPLQIQNNALYFLTDTNELYRGSVPMCKSHYYEGEVEEDETVLHAQARILDGAIPVANDILVLTYENGNRIPYIYTENSGWKSLINIVVSESSEVEAGMDYNALDEEMRKTFVKVISLDMTERYSRFKASTLLIWGDEDQETPLWMAHEMEKRIPDAGLVIFEGGTHFAYLEQISRFNTICRQFLKGEE